jgi:23S rRNA pseudouridine2605 synthase
MRLNRYLAAAGFGSRRACETLIREGRVSINGHFVRNLATVVGAGDDVRVAGSRPARPLPPVYIILHKPRGVVCSRSDEEGRPTIFDLVPRHFGRLFHVGRLDKDSEGLILLTNDGSLSQRLTHPSHTVEKEYEVLLDRPLDPSHVPRLLRGFRLEGGAARVERIQLLAATQLRVVLRQGMKRQIRVMFYRLGYEVKRLLRIRIGGLQLSKLSSGEWRALRAGEVALLTAGDKRKS